MPGDEPHFVKHEAFGTFLGVSPEALHSIGCMAIAAGRLERTIHSVAVDLSIAPTKKKRSSDLLKEIAVAVRDEELPAHNRLERPRDLAEWAHEAGELLKERNQVVHSVAAHQVGTGQVLIPLRAGAPSPLDPESVWDLAVRMARGERQGARLNSALRHNPRLGVYLPNAVWEGEWVPTCWTDERGADILRPTDDELDEWWRTYGPFPRLTE